VKKDSATALSTLFQALGDPTRLRLMNLMTGGEVCVCFFVAVLGEPQPKISRHLAYLRHAGLVEGRRDGKWIHYRIADPLPPGAERLMATLLGLFATDRNMRREREALATACCSTNLPEALLRAPRPQAVELP
jgi:ArsR family transcriptional regulator